MGLWQTKRFWRSATVKTKLGKSKQAWAEGLVHTLGARAGTPVAPPSRQRCAGPPGPRSHEIMTTHPGYWQSPVLNNKWKNHCQVIIWDGNDHYTVNISNVIKKNIEGLKTHASPEWSLHSPSRETQRGKRLIRWMSLKQECFQYFLKLELHARKTPFSTILFWFDTVTKILCIFTHVHNAGDPQPTLGSSSSPAPGCRAPTSTWEPRGTLAPAQGGDDISPVVFTE